MLTRLEVDGFKNLLGFACDFGPYNCIAGPNASGKSNIFDAIQFLALLADHSFMEAAQLLRSDGPRGGDPKTLFWDSSKVNSPEMRLAAEMIVPYDVEDDFGRHVNPTTTFLRYELVLKYSRPPSDSFSQLGRISLVKEELRHITLGDAPARLRWSHSKRRFRDAVVRGRRSGTAYISTNDEDGVVNVHQDGGSRGKPRTSPAARAPRTVVSTTTSSDDPTILAARREMQQWRLLALEPAAMRAPDSASDSAQVSVNGAHLASTLFRMAAERGDDVYAEVASVGSRLIDIRQVRVDLDAHRELLTLEGRIGDGPMLPARSFSDGTLRFLALCILGVDESLGGLICMEEPENGIHPGRIEAMVDLVRDLAVDPREAPGVENPFRQVMVNTHSPYYVQFQDPSDLLVAMPATIRRDATFCTTIRLLPLSKTWRAIDGEVVVSKQAISEYLQQPSDAPLTLDFRVDLAS